MGARGLVVVQRNRTSRSGERGRERVAMALVTGASAPLAPPGGRQRSDGRVARWDTLQRGERLPGRSDAVERRGPGRGLKRKSKERPAPLLSAALD